VAKTTLFATANPGAVSEKSLAIFSIEREVNKHAGQ
jgi:hypothetical protein